MIKKVLFTLLFSSLFPLVLYAHEPDQPPQDLSSEHINYFDSDITVNKDGTIDVTESIYYDFANLNRHGIFRNIPFTKRDAEDKRVDLEFSNFKVTDKNGNPYKFERLTENEQIVLKIGDPTKTVTGKHLYDISYTVSGAIGYFDDYDELYWNVTGNGWDAPILGAAGHINLPDEVDIEKVQKGCITGSFGATEEHCYFLNIDKTIHVHTDTALNPNEGLTVVVGFPKNIVAFLPPTLYVSFWETPLGKLTLVLIGLAAVLWYLILPIALFVLYFYRGRDPFVGRSLTAWYSPPKSKDGRSLTPAETGALIDETVNKRDIFSTIISFAQRGYIRIEERRRPEGSARREKKDFWLSKVNKQKKGDKPLPFEKKLMDGIFEEGNEINLKKTKIYKTIAKVENMLYKDMVSEKYFPHNPKTVRTIYYILGSIALVTFNLALALTAFIVGRIMPRKTLHGAQTANVARGMKNFLNSQERQMNFQGDKQLFFEKLLPYAIAFGVEKNWAKRFEAFDLKSPDWYQGYSGSHFTSAYLASSLSNSYSSFAVSSTPPSSSGSGFSGGGSSGGGGGGGGGGSW